MTTTRLLDFSSCSYITYVTILAVSVSEIAFANVFTRYDDLNGYICYTSGQETTVEETASLVSCANHCTYEGVCKSFFYGVTNRMCVTSASVYGFWSTSDCQAVSNHSYYLMYGATGEFNSSCTIDNYCFYPNSECRYGFCQCRETYSYSPSQRTCLKECTTYGNTFQKVELKVIYGHNLQTVSNVFTREECTFLCANHAACKSADFKFTKNQCTLNSESAATSPGDYMDWPGYDYFQRDCT